MRDPLCHDDGNSGGCYMFAPGTPERETCREQCMLLRDRSKDPPFSVTRAVISLFLAHQRGEAARGPDE